MDDFDLFDLTSPEGLVFVAGSGILDDEQPCACGCGCERTVEWPGDLCEPCDEGRHGDAFDEEDIR